MPNNNAQETALPRPGVQIPPLLIAAVFIILALGLDQVLPLPLPLHELPFGPWIGSAVVAASLILVWFCRQAMRRADTTMHPNRPNNQLVLNGPYRFSRNPIYLALLGLQLGAALFLASPWTLSLLPLLWLILDLYVVVREERYLLQRFGRPYRQFRDSVPRWL